jgi:hypothetical protein
MTTAIYLPTVPSSMLGASAILNPLFIFFYSVQFNLQITHNNRATLSSPYRCY